MPDDGTARIEWNSLGREATERLAEALVFLTKLGAAQNMGQEVKPHIDDEEMGDDDQLASNQ